MKKFLGSIKAWLAGIDRWQQRGTVVRPVWDTRHRRCTSCDAEFEGNFCPQCGFKADRAKITMRSAVLNFLDVWGMGSRSMWRNIKELFWRPGYMIADYLDGGQQRYFPPIKMLVVMTLGLALTIMAMDIPFVNDPILEVGDFETCSDLLGFEELSEEAVRLATYAETLATWLADRPVFELIFLTLFISAACTLVLRRQPGNRRMNFAESFFTIIFISCQMQICTIIYVICTGEVFSAEVYPFSLPDLLAAAIMCYDFKQLCRVGFLRSALYTLAISVLLIVNFVCFIGIVYGALLGIEYIEELA